MEWLRNISAPWNKTMVEIDYTKKLLQLTLGGWLWVLLDGLDSLFQGSDALLVKVMAEELQRCCS